MRYLLLILAVIAGLWGLLLLLMASSALHEIQAYIALLASAVLLSGAGIIEAIVALQRSARTSGPGPGV